MNGKQEMEERKLACRVARSRTKEGFNNARMYNARTTPKEDGLLCTKKFSLFTPFICCGCGWW